MKMKFLIAILLILILCSANETKKLELVDLVIVLDDSNSSLQWHKTYILEKGISSDDLLWEMKWTYIYFALFLVNNFEMQTEKENRSNAVFYCTSNSIGLRYLEIKHAYVYHDCTLDGKVSGEFPDNMPASLIQAAKILQGPGSRNNTPKVTIGKKQCTYIVPTFYSPFFSHN